MVKEIIWSEKADKSFNNIIDYLLKHFTEREVSRFVLKVNDKINFIRTNPNMYPAAIKRKNIRSTSILHRTKMFYQFFPRKKLVIILLFWDMRQDSKELKRLLH
jgi:plasmid stabilization system protein ParE